MMRALLMVGSCQALNLNVARLPSRALHRAVSSFRSEAFMAVETSNSGEFGTTDFTMSFSSEGKPFSPWHDAPLELEGGLYNMLTEIPKMSKEKMEVWREGGRALFARWHCWAKAGIPIRAGCHQGRGQPDHAG
jgi:hypothetical protein